MRGRISAASIQQVIDRLDAISVVGEQVRLEKRSGRWWGCCPFHNEKTPSFTVDPDKKVYYCFGCHKGGSIIDFVMETEKTSYPETIELLAKKAGVELIYEGGDAEADHKERETRDALLELLERVAGSFHYLLMESPEGKAALNYISHRGISKTMLESFRLGYSREDREWLHAFLRSKGYSDALLAQSGLFSAKYPRSSFFSHRLMFPIADRQHHVVAFGGRLLAGEGPKYLNSPESPLYKKGETLFAIDQAMEEIRRTKEAYLAEGYMDVIALHQAGVQNAVAPLGTAFTAEQARLLKRWAEKLYLIFDADQAGQNAIVKAILTSRKAGIPAYVLRIGEGIPQGDGGERGDPTDPKDPADILKNYGEGALKNSVKSSILDFEYLLARSRTLFDTSRAEGKAQAVASLFPYVETIGSEVSRDACIGEIAGAFGVERQAVMADYEQYNRHSVPLGSGSSTREARAPRREGVRINDELLLLTAVCVHHEAYPKLRSTLSIEELEDPQAKELFIALEEWYRDQTPSDKEGDTLPHELLSRIQDGELRSFVIAQGASNAFSPNSDAFITQGMGRVRVKRLERRQREITIALTQGETGRDVEDLLAEKVHIDAELRRFKESNHD